MTTDSSAADKLPRYARRLWAFGFINAACFNIVLGAPMVLCVRYLGGSESLVGLLLALTPLCATLQLPAARYADRWGYRRLMVTGWRIRAYAVLLMVPLPLLVKVVPQHVLLLLFAAFAVMFNVIRGFASGAWNPWLRHLVAPALRGRYFSIESIIINTGSLLTLLAGGLVLGHHPGGARFAILLAVSGTAGVLCVLPLKNVPAAGPAAESAPAAAAESVPAVLRRVWRNADYRRLVRFATLNSFALTAAGGFMVLYLKEIVGLGDGPVVTITSSSLAGAMAGAFLLSRYLDRVGSRPVMRIAGIGLLGYFLFWTVFAALGHGASIPLFLLLFILGGVIGNAAVVATGRLILNTCPREDVTIALALSQAGQTLSAGIAAVAWGFALEWMRADTAFGPLSRWPYVIFFAGTLACAAAAQIALRHVREEAAMPSERFFRALLVEWPQRMWIRDDG